MKLYGERLPAPNPRRVRIFLAEKGIAIPYEDVPLRKAAHKTPEFKRKNSLGQVPVLELDDGSFLSESVSICRYLEVPDDYVQLKAWHARVSARPSASA